MKKLDNKILSLLKKHNILTEAEIEAKLGYDQLYQRLRKLVNEGKIRVIKYGNKNFYYIDENKIRKWAIKNIKDYKLLKRIVPESKYYKVIGVREHIYNELEKKAKKRNKSVKQIVEEILLEAI